MIEIAFHGGVLVDDAAHGVDVRQAVAGRLRTGVAGHGDTAGEKKPLAAVRIYFQKSRQAIDNDRPVGYEHILLRCS